MFNGKKRFGLATLACVSLAIAFSAPAAAWNRGAVQPFALLPEGAHMVEGLTVGPDGKVYSPTFNPAGSGPSQLFTFDPQGHLLKQVTITGSSSAMLGLAVIPNTTNALLVIDFLNSQVLMVDPTKDTNNASVCITFPPAPPTPDPGSHGLNALTFDSLGNVYISDSFQGAIWVYKPGKTASTYCSPSTQATAWVGPNDPTLEPFNGVPGFGANGIEFNNAGDTMFVCNTAMDWIVKIHPTGDTPGKPEVFTNSINGCDGIAIDRSDNIWAAANQSDEIVVVDSTTGKAIAKLGSTASTTA
jgi:sugar lactone lactonase YvrE